MSTEYLLSNGLLGKTDKVVFGYSPNDFYYNVVNDNAQTPYKLDSVECEKVSTFTKDSEQCNDANFDTNKDKCVQQQLCENKQVATDLTELQKQSNGADEKFNDTNIENDYIVYNIVNLGIGIAAMLGFIVVFNDRS